MNHFGVGFGTEIIYSFVIIACSLIIYFSTKELYELSNHQGIKYFRYAFLFFAIAYFFRSFIKFILVYFNLADIFNTSPRIIMPIFTLVTLSIFMYFSSMAIFYLLYSVMYKKLKKNKQIYWFHALALLIALVTIFYINPILYLGINIFLFMFILVVVLYSRSKTSKGLNLYAIYLLLLVFWLLNILDILIPNFFHTFQLLIYLASTLTFLLILYKVVKNTGN